MADVIIAPDAQGWTVRHPRRLFERVKNRQVALSLATRHAQALATPEEPCAVVEHRSFGAAGRPPRHSA